MRPEIIALRNKLQPKYENNTDPLIFDYRFWTELEKLAKKEREAALDRAKAFSSDPEKEGLVIKGKALRLMLKISSPPKAFDKETFMNTISEQFKIEKHKLREIATASVAEGTPRKSYTVEDREDD